MEEDDNANAWAWMMTVMNVVEMKAAADTASDSDTVLESQPISTSTPRYPLVGYTHVAKCGII